MVQEVVCGFGVNVVNVSSAGTAVQFSANPDRVRRISITAQPGNTGNVFIGKSDVSSTNGKTLAPGESVTLNYDPNTVPLSDFYVDAANNNDKIEWILGAEAVTGTAQQSAHTHDSHTGILSVTEGGTGVVSVTDGGLVIGKGTSAFENTGVLAKGALVVGDGTTNPAIRTVGSNDRVLTADSAEDDGVKWAAASGGGTLVLLSSSVASASADVTITGLDSTYDVYLIALSDVVAATDGTQMRIRVGDSGGVDSGATDYGYHAQTVQGSATTYSAVASTGDSSILLTSGAGNAAGEGMGAVIWLTRPGDGTTEPNMSGTYTYFNTSGAIRGGALVGARLAVITLDRLNFSFTSGNIASGRFSVYGVSHA